MEQPIRVLYIDDSATDRELVSHALAQESPARFALTLATSQLEFQKALQAQTYDLVLTDFNILGLTGFQVMDLIHQANLDLPIVIVTGTGSEEIAVEAMKRGAGDYVLKSVQHIQRLPQTILAVLDKEQMVRQQVQAQKELHLSEERYRSLFENAAVGIFHCLPGGALLRLNQALAAMHGYATPAEMSADIPNMVPLLIGDYARVAALFAQVREQDGWVTGQVETRHKNSRTVVCDLALRRVKDDAGKIAYLEGLVEDITRRTQAEDALKRTQGLLSAILEHAPLPIYTTSRDDRMLVVNRAWEESRHIPREKALGARIDEIFTKDLARHFHDDNHKVLDNEMPIQFEETMHDPAGRHTFQTIKFPLKDEKGEFYAVGGISIDISERIHAEDALRQSESFNRAVLDSLGAHIAVLNSQGKVIATNEAWNRFARENGAPESAHYYLGANYLDVCSAGIRGNDSYARQTLTGLEQVLLGQKPDFTLEYPCDAPGDARWFNLHITTLKDHRGSVVVAHENITARKLAEEALRREQSLMRALMDHVPDTIYFKDLESRFLRINQAQAARLQIASPDEALGKTDFDYFGAEYASQAIADEQQIMRDGQAIVNREERENWPDRPDSWVSTTKMPMFDNTGQLIGTFGLSRDITIRKQAEESVRRQNEYLLALQATTLDLVSQLDLDNLLENILLRACQLTGAPSGVLFLVSADWQTLNPRVGKGVLSSLLNYPLHKGDGLSGKVWETGAPIVVEAYDDWPGRLPELPGNLVSAMLGIPLVSAVGIQGVLELAFEEPVMNRFTSETLDQMTQFARLAAIAIENAQLFADSQQRLRFIQSLRTIDQTITGTFDLRVVANTVLAEINIQFKLDAVDLLVLNPGSNMLEYYQGRGFRTEFLRHTHLRIGEGFAGRAALEGRMLAIPDLALESSSMTHAAKFREEGFASYFAVPLIAKGMVKGVLEVFHRSPMQPDANWLSFLQDVAGTVAIALDNSVLVSDLQRSSRELSAAYDDLIQGLSRALDLRDQETGDHSVGLMRLVERLARQMQVSEEELVHIRRGALLHDIGKIGVPDLILRKPGALSPEEWVIMRQHPVLARDLLEPVQFLHPAMVIPYRHHEKWDGTGYPDGLAGAEIPLAARMFSIVDVFDALIHDRVYRKAWPLPKVLAYLREQDGKHFEPRVVEAFLSVIESDDGLTNEAKLK